MNCGTATYACGIGGVSAGFSCQKLLYSILGSIKDPGIVITRDSIALFNFTYGTAKQCVYVNYENRDRKIRRKDPKQTVLLLVDRTVSLFQRADLGRARREDR